MSYSYKGGGVRADSAQRAVQPAIRPIGGGVSRYSYLLSLARGGGYTAEVNCYFIGSALSSCSELLEEPLRVLNWVC